MQIRQLPWIWLTLTRGAWLRGRAPRRLLGGAGLLAALLLTTGCGLQKDVDVDLPAEPAQLVVECYLEDGKVPELTVTETVPYLSAPTATVLNDVTVTLTSPTGRVETLVFRPGRNFTTRKFYTHRGLRVLRIRPGDTWQLSVKDTKGRVVTGAATMPATVPFDTVEWKFNDRPADERRALVTVKFQDPPGVGDYYRFQIHRDSISGAREVDYNPEDRLLDGQLITLGTSYEFEPDDTLFVTLYHLDRPYYRFLQSVDDAQSANGNPFGQPAAVQSTVQGGIGVFTILNYQRRQIIVR
ncbi:DUF4249 domain-containing protein [Hymenobacter sp. 15J16-1T3B]|uniref:DUF4249 domain-containing protein n=1 Tax=Hymenobacter sp. 15J16-1T3B TaxID=2886941 RepID=UPI001D12090A|nr:DUF4249 domain-containing protein [Hymenobacter sp. 15J16-1T3B]MCC3158280.1 DUF4249 domain-containing protein [Hymenobacter sp. 15J16-1T3B]